jgi:hypothetical protein
MRTGRPRSQQYWLAGFENSDGRRQVPHSPPSLLKSNPTNALQDIGIQGCDYFFGGILI